MQSMKNFLGKLQEKVDFSKRFGIIQIKIEVFFKSFLVKLKEYQFLH